MKKKGLMILTTVLVICLTTVFLPALAEAKTVRGVWISCFDFESAGLKDKPEAEFRANAKIMFDKVKKEGCNTVFFHVRAFDDAIWPSVNFPMSKYVSSNGSLPYDAMAILVTEAHKRGLKIHAWMNPYRVTYSKILDPAQETSIQRILLAVREVLTKYKVDGIHFDDYFYPSGSNKQYKQFKSLSQSQKMANVNKMVRRVYSTVKSYKNSLKFGISPAGELSYSRSLGADVDTWLSVNGYVDYVVPQIYWTNTYLLNGKTVPFFSNQLAAWKAINKLNKPIYWGLALYRAGMKSSTDKGWKKRNNNIALQVKEISEGGGKGYVLFSYNNFLKESGKKEMSNYRKQIASVKISLSKKSVKKKKTKKLKVTVFPSSVTKKPTFKSSNKKIATVSKKGVVKGKKKGKVTITASLYGKKCSIKIRVK